MRKCLRRCGLRGVRELFSGIYIIALLFVFLVVVVMLRELDSCTDRLRCFLIIRNNARLVIG